MISQWCRKYFISLKMLQDQLKFKVLISQLIIGNEIKINSKIGGMSIRHNMKFLCLSVFFSIHIQENVQTGTF